MAYPVTQFQDLSHRIKKSVSKSRVKTFEQPEISPREEIYKSMIREIRNGDVTQMNSLVHKASGILRLAHYNEVMKARKVTVSWDIDGRRVLKYEDKSGTEKSVLQRESSTKTTKKGLLSSLNEPIFGLDSHNLQVLSEYMLDKSKRDEKHNYGGTDGELPPRNKVSKVWANYIDTGDVSNLWKSKEGILSTESKASITSSSAPSASENVSLQSLSQSKSNANDFEERPPWKTFYKASSTNNLPVGNSFHSSISSSLPTMSPLERRRSGKKNRIVLNTRRSAHQSSINAPEDTKEKVDRIQHICVVNGSVVAFKNFGFENFSNWFGDETALENNQQRSQPAFHRELDLTNVRTRDIKIRLLDGRKLEVDSKCRVPGTTKPIRRKDVILIPECYRPEDLLMCRTKTGKLVMEEITPQPIPTKKGRQKSKSSKLKAQWRISRKV